MNSACPFVGHSAAHVSELKNYKLSRFSSERLLHCITLLNRDPCMPGTKSELSSG